MISGTSNKTITDRFTQYFELKVASTPQEYNEIFSLRYEVFCREYGFEKESDCPNQRESDQYDGMGPHCIIYHKATNAVVGCVRILLPNKKKPSAQLPFEPYCNLPNYDNFCEFSRLTVSKQFRRRQGDLNVSLGDQYTTHKISTPTDTMHRNFPMVPVSLMLSAISVGRHLSIDHGFAMMEPKLAAAMRNYGIEFMQVGKLVQYHGQRAAFIMNPMEIEQHLLVELHDFFNYIDTKLAQATLNHINNRYNTKLQKRFR